MFSGRVAGESARFLMKSSLCSDEICVADEIQTIVWMKSNPPIRRRGAFHPRRGFHRRRRFHPPVRVDLVEKSTSCEVLFSWQGQKDSIPPRSRTARPDVLLRSTTRAELPTYRNQNKKPPKATFLFWQGQKDSNPRPMVLETSTLPTELYPCMERVTGIEPARPAWKAGILPLNYTRI